jgi:hypothetical protein
MRATRYLDGHKYASSDPHAPTARHEGIVTIEDFSGPLGVDETRRALEILRAIKKRPAEIVETNTSNTTEDFHAVTDMSKPIGVDKTRVALERLRLARKLSEDSQKLLDNYKMDENYDLSQEIVMAIKQWGEPEEQRPIAANIKTKVERSMYYPGDHASSPSQIHADESSLITYDECVPLGGVSDAVDKLPQTAFESKFSSFYRSAIETAADLTPPGGISHRKNMSSIQQDNFLTSSNCVNGQSSYNNRNTSRGIGRPYCAQPRGGIYSSDTSYIRSHQSSSVPPPNIAIVSSTAGTDYFGNNRSRIGTPWVASTTLSASPMYETSSSINTGGTKDSLTPKRPGVVMVHAPAIHPNSAMYRAAYGD